MTPLDLHGKRFGTLTAIRVVGSDARYGRIWLCHCDCGRTAKIGAGRLAHRNRQFCGLGHPRKHGQTRRGEETPEYRAWANMIKRCTNPKVPKYECYGGRGIKVCRHWRDFRNFFADMGLRPRGGNHRLRSEYSLDRIDNDGHYTRENCRWTTQKIQVANRRK